MRLSNSLLFALAVAVLGGATARAQQAELREGARVRLITSSLKTDQQVARVVSTGNDSIVFRSDAYPVTRSLALSEIERIDVSQGRRRLTVEGAVIGLGAGVALGATLGALSYTPCEGLCFMGTSRGETATIVAAMLGSIGVATGAIIGASRETEAWKPITVHPTAAINQSGQRIFGIQLSHTF
ncbi:MAG: hypothetical protein ACJ785_00810 [Gemmatimonadaceae bacterium]